MDWVLTPSGRDPLVVFQTVQTSLGFESGRFDILWFFLSLSTAFKKAID